MEKLLHYVWKFRLYGLEPLKTNEGDDVEILDPGLHNNDAGPDFLNAKIKIGGILWVGNVEIHLRSSDWQRHHHHTNPAYNNVVLHVVKDIDTQVINEEGRILPQLALKIPPSVQEHYDELCLTADYPRCWRIIKELPTLTIHSWMSALLIERITERAQNILQHLNATQGHWERTAFITLARTFGFGLNGNVMETWAANFPLSAAMKHRDNLAQLQALFLGTANLLDSISQHPADDIPVKELQREWIFLSNKFNLEPLIASSCWHYLRLRPRNFPHRRILQLAEFFHHDAINFTNLLTAPNRQIVHTIFSILSPSTADLIIINTIVPLRYAHALYFHDEDAQQQALSILEELKAEDNFMIRQWKQCGLSVATASDTQALIQLKRNYCDCNDCLRCRFGYEYLKAPSLQR